MSEIKQIADQLKRSVTGGAWHGPSVMECIDGVDFQMAAAYPLAEVHNIWEILLHIGVWIKFTGKALDGQAMPANLAENEDWPPITAADTGNWQDTIISFQKEYDLLLHKLSGFNESGLSDTVPGRNYSYYFLLHGIVQHNLYHAGQISLLKSSLIRSQK